MRWSGLLLAVALCLMASGQAKKHVFTPPDGHWWLNASSEEQDGFYIGFYDCNSILHGNPGPSGIPDRDVEAAVTSYYDAHHAEKGLPVALVIGRLYSDWRQKKAYKFVHADPSNEYNGDMWMGGDVKAGYRIAIIKGFLSCQAANRMPLAAMSPARLEARVSRWYGTGKEETLAQKHGNDKLGAVILRAEKEPGGGH